MKLNIDITPDQEEILDLINLKSNPKNTPLLEDFVLSLLESEIVNLVSGYKKSILEEASSKLHLLTQEELAAIIAKV